jgi:N-acetylglucosaminyldiphosphoundecaprenol N-acetyl-beta-D-mannosaminyltransferase
MTEIVERPVDRAVVMGCPIDRLDMPETLGRIERFIAEGAFAQHVAINAAKIVAMQDDPSLRGIIERCELVSADGQAIVWASRLLGDRLPTRVAGIDLFQQLLALAERRGYRVFILGAKPDVLDRAVARIRERHPDLQLAGARDGYFSDEEAPQVAEQIKESRADLLFVAMPSPRKEYWLGDYGRRVGVPFVMGVGGSVDVLSGMTQRAPRFLQVIGMEWFYRFAQEPSRLWRRYLTTNVRFLGLLAQHLARRAISAVRP